jgi:AcrR family transcriptional regulator
MVGVKGQSNKRGVARREAILKAATAAIVRDGARALTLAGVAAAAGVTPGNVLHHFGSRERLLRLVIREHAQAKGHDALEHVLAGRGLDIFHRMMVWSELNQATPGMAAAFIIAESEAISGDEEGTTLFRVRNRAVRGAISDAVRYGQTRGEIRPEVDPDAIGAEVHAFVDGAALLWLIDQERLSIETLYRNFLNRLILDLTLDPEVKLIAKTSSNFASSS